MLHYVVDASVAVEFVLETQLGVDAAGILRNNRLSAPELLDLEVLSALRKFVLSNELSDEAALSAIAELEQLRVRRVSHEGLAELTWQYHRNVSIYDAIYLATAKKQNLEVLTADSRLSRAPGVDVVVHDLRDPNVLDRLETL